MELVRFKNLTPTQEYVYSEILPSSFETTKEATDFLRSLESTVIDMKSRLEKWEQLEKFNGMEVDRGKVKSLASAIAARTQAIGIISLSLEEVRRKRTFERLNRLEDEISNVHRRVESVHTRLGRRVEHLESATKAIKVRSKWLNHCLHLVESRLEWAVYTKLHNKLSACDTLLDHLDNKQFPGKEALRIPSLKEFSEHAPE